MFRADTAVQDSEAVSPFVMRWILVGSGGASTVVVGLYLERSVLERTCEDFLPRCVGRLCMKIVKARRARKRGGTTPRTTCWHCSSPGCSQALVLDAKEGIMLG